MAGGMTYTAIDSTALQTAEIYGKALVELAQPEISGSEQAIDIALGVLVHLVRTPLRCKQAVIHSFGVLPLAVIPLREVIPYIHVHRVDMRGSGESDRFVYIVYLKEVGKEIIRKRNAVRGAGGLRIPPGIALQTGGNIRLRP